MPDNNKHELPELLRDLRERGDGYAAPGEDYFAALAERTAWAGKQAPVRRLSIFRWAGAAAAALLVLFAAWFILSPNDPGAVIAAEARPSSEDLLAEIDPEVINEYVSEQLDDFTMELYDAAPLNE